MICRSPLLGNTLARNFVGDWKAFLFESSIQQGPSFLVLVLILYGLWGFGEYIIHEGIPNHLLQIQSGYEKIQQAQDKNIDRLIADQDKNFDRLITEQHEEHILMRDAVDKITILTKMIGDG